MNFGDTIVAPCTPPGQSTRAMIRISGARAIEAAGACAALPAGRGARASRWRLGSLEAPVLVARYEAGASYTGEDVVEIVMASGLAARVLEGLLAELRLAEPGEFTARAYLNGRLSLDEAEGVAGVIAAETAAQLDGARDLMSGRTGARYAAWADELTSLLALVEAGIDFTDQEDVVAIEPGELGRRLAALETELSSLGVDAGSGTPLVVLVGEPNAGKSTLFNALLGRRRAVVSDEAGTTRDVLTESLDLSNDAAGAGVVTLADMAGVESGASSVAAAQAQARETIGRADVLVWCDPSGRFTGFASGTTTVRVRTKADRPGSDSGADVSVCALEGRVATLRRAIADAAWRGRDRSALIVPRHRRAVSAALAHVRTAQAVDAQESELVASALRGALDAIGELTGRVHPDDVIGRVFATFCVGK